MEIPNELSHIFDCCCVHERASRGIVYAIVAQEEFYRVREEIFGNPNDLGEWSAEIAYDNVQSVIFGH